MHIMKQINSLKVENLEVKKMLKENLKSENRLSGSHKRVSISQYNDNTSANKSDLYSIKSVKSSKPSRISKKTNLSRTRRL